MITFRNFGKTTFAKLALATTMVMAGTAAQAGQFLYTGGHDIDNGRLAAFGHTSTYFTPDDAGWATALSGGNGPFDAVIIGENQHYYSISPSTQAAIAAYVSGGGRAIIVDDHNGNLDVLNSIFGFSASLAFGCTSDDSVAGTLQPAATGTSFAGGPASVAKISCTSGLVTSTLPPSAIPMYADDYFGTPATVTFVSQYGSGVLAQLGFDLYGSNDEGLLDDWYAVLDSAFRYAAIPTYANLRLSFSGPSTSVRGGSTVPVYARLDNYGRDSAKNTVVNINVNYPVGNASITAPAGWTCGTSTPEKGLVIQQVPAIQFHCTANSMPRSSVLFKLLITTPGSAAPNGFVTINGDASSASIDSVPGNNEASFKLYVKANAAIAPIKPPLN